MMEDIEKQILEKQLELSNLLNQRDLELVKSALLEKNKNIELRFEHEGLQRVFVFNRLKLIEIIKGL